MKIKEEEEKEVSMDVNNNVEKEECDWYLYMQDWLTGWQMAVKYKSKVETKKFYEHIESNKQEIYAFIGSLMYIATTKSIRKLFKDAYLRHNDMQTREER